MKKICKNCKYWISGDELGWTGNWKKFGKCACKKFQYLGLDEGNVDSIIDSVIKAAKSDELLFIDFEYYNADFYTGENFGCIHFKPKEK